jgi:hypothetical protein
MPTSHQTLDAVPMAWLGRWTALMALVLLGSTWPLWFGKGEFPVVPLVGGLQTIAGWADRVCLAGLLGGLLFVLIASDKNRVAQRSGWVLIFGCGFVLVLLDQHRLQPWFYQLLLFAIILCLCHPQQSGLLLRWFVVSIYFFSALGKFDYEFLHTVGQQFWGAAIKWIGGEAAPGTQTSIVLIALLPAAELLLALGLAFRPTRLIASGLACVFHVTLMLVLGPLGLKHSWGVFWWNLQFAGQACLLFGWPQIQLRLATSRAVSEAVEPRGNSSLSVVSRRQRWSQRCATVVTFLAIVLPTLERMGYWDHWTSWALYAPHSSRVEVWIASSAVDELPASLQQLLGPEQEREAVWVRMPLERWSLAQTGSPIYPQARFQLGVALALTHYLQSEFELKAVVRGVSARWDGKRWERELEGATPIARAAQTLFWLNSQPRL